MNKNKFKKRKIRDNENFSYPKKRKKRLNNRERHKRDIIFVIKFFVILICTLAIIIFFCNYKAFDIKDYEITGNVYTNNYKSTLDKYIGCNIFVRNKANIEKSLKKNNIIEFCSIKKLTKAQRSKQRKIQKAKENNEYTDLIVVHNIKENKSISIIDDIIIKRKLPNKLIIEVIEKKPVCCFTTPSGQYLINNNGRVFYKLKSKDIYSNIPTVYSKRNNILLGENIYYLNTYETTFCYELAKTCYNNNLKIKSIQIQNKFEIIMYTTNGILINFGVTADLVDKIYLLKQIFREKANLLDDISEIYIIDSKTATYKLKQKENGQNIKN